MIDRHNPPTDLAQLITQHFGKLTDADTRLLKVLTSDPIRGAFENSTEVASRAGVHPASAMRLARRLGFKGYPEFRAFMQTSLMEGQDEFADPTARIAARLARAGEGGLLSSLIDSEVSALEHLRDNVTDAQIRVFSEVLYNARRIFTVGTSHGTALAKLIALRLRRSGYEAIDLGSVEQQQVEWVYTMGPRDVLFLSCFRGTTTQLKHLTDLAGERDAACLILCDVEDTRIKGPKNSQICVSRGGAGESQSLVVPMTIANTIILDLASIDAGKTMRSLNTFKRVREDLNRVIK
ncbi:MurR/RpiR family transcriptional regulator [Celeribacter halophilus]|uniref:MurR/RpiR family transcriptional regulator n=1 Tax=Celeribacter halophilus TaxID=576117 RepID=UPI001C091538|nr:MurR/RpiR family transcriptional regulator [Celeribacter halophilus]MBU2891315.1 MurR/RpiR family transcriptional regulator [Celeribacter halophilus]MDO6512421.1 MurR/RpiR family transcriptional regulator [Celeribacter halophilus]